MGCGQSHFQYQEAGVTFDEAATIFRDAFALTVFDVNHSQPEERWFTVGYDGGGLLLAVAHTFQIVTTNNVRIRIISARKATPREREFYENEPRWVTAMTTAGNPPQNDGMPDEIDFSGGMRGKFYQPGAGLHLPVYLDAEVQAYLTAIASKKGIALSDLANDLLKKEIAILETVK